MDDEFETTDTVEEPAKESGSLKNKLSDMNTEKEKLYTDRQAVRDKIRSLIEGIREKKTERNSLTDQVKALKEKRSAFNEQLGVKLKEFRDLIAKHKGATSTPAKFPVDKRGRRITPDMMQKEIESLELKIETEGVNFAQEQKMMAKIKELKKQIAELGGVQAGSARISELKREITEIKRQADAVHHDIQEKAKLSQQKHEQILEQSKKIEELRAQEQALDSQFGEAMQKFQAENQTYREKSHASRESDDRAHHAKREKQKKHEDQQDKLLHDKQELVHQKMKKGEKLTTEDFLVLQSEHDTSQDSEDF